MCTYCPQGSILHPSGCSPWGSQGKFSICLSTPFSRAPWLILSACPFFSISWLQLHPLTLDHSPSLLPGLPASHVGPEGSFCAVHPELTCPSPCTASQPHWQGIPFMIRPYLISGHSPPTALYPPNMLCGFTLPCPHRILFPLPGGPLLSHTA